MYMKIDYVYTLCVELYGEDVVTWLPFYENNYEIT